jgi:thiol-disulfide isomerase/thioredoxin
MVSKERFAQGMTFDEYVKFVSTPENLKREGSFNMPRKDYGEFLRKAFESAQLSDAQREAWQWITSQPNGPARMLVISEEWSSDCRRDVPALARLAEAGGLELRIFARDGKKMSRSSRPMPDESPNADLMAEFLNEKNGQTFQSIPVAVFYDKDLRELYRYIEFPACYHKDRIRGHQTSARPGESAEQTAARATKEFATMLASPMLDVWSSATIDEILSMLYERAVVGSLAK